MGVGSEIKKLPAVFLDRDGVLNKAVVRDGKPYPPASLAELELIEGAQDLVRNLKQLGFMVFVFTNQPDVARGTTPLSRVNEIHDYMIKTLGVDKIYCCLHDDADDCVCRKPKPGMILQAAREWSIDLPTSFVVGDRWRDIAAGKAANVTSILLDYGYDERQEHPDFACANLSEVFLTIKKNHTRTYE